jgi:acetyl esterase/lipase
MNTALRTLAAAVPAMLAGPDAARADDPTAERTGPAQSYEVEASRDLAYCKVPHDPDPARHRLDVFRPAGQTGRPVLMFVHGGGWTIGRKDNYFGILGYGTVAECLARRGLVVVLPNYRLSPGVRHPAHIKDVARAFAWTCRNAAKFGGDPKRIYVGGHSAGGHLTALLTTDETYLKEVGRSRKDIRGVIGISGVYCVEDLQLDLSASAPGEWLHLDTKVSPFALVFGTDRKTLEQASPIRHVCPGLPPFLLLNGTLDYPPLRKMTKDFAAALEDSGCKVRVKQFPWLTHETVVFDILNRTAEPATVEAVVEFIEQCQSSKRR